MQNKNLPEHNNSPSHSQEDRSNPNISPKSKKSTWVAFIPFLYLLGFMGLGIFLFWSEAMDSTSMESGGSHWVKVVFSSLFYLVFGGIGFVTISIYTLYRLIRDKALFLAVQRHWPLLVAVLYFFIPNLPGPVDEIVVSGIMGALATYLGWKGANKT